MVYISSENNMRFTKRKKYDGLFSKNFEQCVNIENIYRSI